jgi:hypothetical protein
MIVGYNTRLGRIAFRLMKKGGGCEKKAKFAPDKRGKTKRLFFLRRYENRQGMYRAA